METCLVTCMLRAAGYESDQCWSKSLMISSTLRMAWHFFTPYQPLWIKQFMGIPLRLSLLTQIKDLRLKSMIPLSTQPCLSLRPGIKLLSSQMSLRVHRTIFPVRYESSTLPMLWWRSIAIILFRFWSEGFQLSNRMPNPPWDTGAWKFAVGISFGGVNHRLKPSYHHIYSISFSELMVTHLRTMWW